MLSERIMELIRTIAENEGFSDYKIDSADGSSHGVNFMATITAIKISGLKASDKIEELHLVCKAPPANELRKRNLSMSFSREIYVYTKILPAFVQFQREKGLSKEDSFLSFPKVYASEIDVKSDTFILIMEDMRSKEYQMWPKEKVIPLDYELMIMRELGKFHAISFAMKDQKPDEFEEFTQIEDPFVPIVIHGRMRSFNNKSLEKAAKVLEKPEHKQLLINFRETFPNIISDLLTGESSKESRVICHGDLWSCNILFRRDDMDHRCKSICFLDWQLTKYCPPVLDLHYNIFSITDKQLRNEHYDKLLETYYASLSRTIDKLGSDPNKIYTFKDFKGQLRKFAPFALLCGPVLLQFKVASAKDIKNLDDYCELVEKGEQPDLMNEFDESTLQKYSTLINDLVADLVEFGYIEIQ